MKAARAKKDDELPNPTNAKQLAQALFARSEQVLPASKRRLTKQLKRKLAKRR